MKSNSILIQHFIKDIWNEKRFDLLADYIHDDFIDHSLLGHLPPNAEGLTTWVLATGKAFRHRSVIEEQVTERDRSMIKFRMDLEHIGVWRDIKPQGAQISVVGYRCFRIKEGKIIEHWALLDGNSIENQLKDSELGCKTQK